VVATSANALGDYLRARRDQLRPDDVGLRPGARRRVPGLRREEVATPRCARRPGAVGGIGCVEAGIDLVDARRELVVHRAKFDLAAAQLRGGQRRVQADSLRFGEEVGPLRRP
jgi:hypothetical protein